MKFTTRISESTRLTFNFLRANKLRSFLSILGVTIGIFCIVGVWTATHSLEQNIRKNVDQLGDKIIYVQKWPWGFGGGTYKWWEYMNRKEADLREFKRLTREANKTIVKETAFFYEFGGKSVKSSVEELTDVKVNAVYGDFLSIAKWKLFLGREFTALETGKGKNVAIVGYNLGLNLFKGANPIGKTVKMNGVPIDIIGVLELQGNSMGGAQHDDVMVLPAMFAQRFAKPNTNGVSSAIVIDGQPDVDLKLLEFEITRIMRSMRKLSPKEKDDFAINKLTMFSDALDQTFGMINAVAVIIGLLSLLVGGFGIANIMFVSVKERTSIIGLQKSLGARKNFILLQFLIEAIILCLLGALIGILMVYIGGFIVSATTTFTIYFSGFIITACVLGSAFIGLIAGLAPAYQAANLDPVVAIRK